MTTFYTTAAGARIDVTTLQTEQVPCGRGQMTRLAVGAATPQETYRQAAALAATVYPREVGTDAVRRLHGLSHQEALHVAADVTPITLAFTSDRERQAFERGQERAMGLEED